MATVLGVHAARSVGAKPLFFTWQNLYRRYPPPFRWFEQIVYRACPVAIAGNAEAAAVLVRKGYQGDVVVLPQFGVDPMIFRPQTGPSEGLADVGQQQGAALASDPRPFHIGYAGGLLPEKGLDLLLRACAGLVGAWRLTLAGSGEELAALQRLAADAGIAERVTLGVKLPSAAMPDFYRSLDLLALPSRTRPNWKEQFGRVLIEAMACGVPVLGSDSRRDSPRHWRCRADLPGGGYGGSACTVAAADGGSIRPQPFGPQPAESGCWPGSQWQRSPGRRLPCTRASDASPPQRPASEYGRQLPGGGRQQLLPQPAGRARRADRRTSADGLSQRPQLSDPGAGPALHPLAHRATAAPHRLGTDGSASGGVDRPGGSGAWAGQYAAVGDERARRGDRP